MKVLVEQANIPEKSYGYVSSQPVHIQVIPKSRVLHDPENCQVNSYGQLQHTLAPSQIHSQERVNKNQHQVNHCLPNQFINKIPKIAKAAKMGKLDRVASF